MSSSILVVKYSPNFGYGTSNPASIPLKQYIQNGATNVNAGMPQKTGYADNTATFGQGRNKFIKASTCSIYLQDESNPLNCNTGVIRVDATNVKNQEIECKNLYKVHPLIQNGEYTPNKDAISSYGLQSGTWSRSNHTIHNRQRNQVACSASSGGTCLLNGKQNNIMSSQELINRRKNIAIGRGSQNTNNGLSFNDNNLNGSHTNYLAVSDARRRTRNGGYIVPPKCRGQGSGPSGPFGALQNQGTGFDNSKGIHPVPDNMCGKSGWPVSRLLGNPSNKTILYRGRYGVVNRN